MGEFWLVLFLVSSHNEERERERERERKREKGFSRLFL